MSPKLRAVLFPILALIAGSLATYFSSGCTPSQIQKAESTVDRVAEQAICLKDAAKALDDLLLNPEQLNLNDLKAARDAARKALKDCLHPAPVGDAGT